MLIIDKDHAYASVNGVNFVERTGKGGRRAHYMLNKWVVMNIDNATYRISDDTINWTEYSYLYARYVLKGRFELGEILIAANPEYSYLYARDILKGRFELGEQAIAGDSDFKKEYFELTGIEL